MKREFAGRPLLGVLGCFIVGLTAASHPLNLILLVIPFWLYASLNLRIVLALTFAIGAFFAPQPAVLVTKSKPFNGEAVVISPPAFHEDAVSFDARAAGMSFSVFVQGRPNLAYGTTVHLEGTLKPPTQGSELYQATKGISGKMTAKVCTVTHPAPVLFQAAENWRGSFIEFAYQALPPREAALISALCFNTQSLVDDDTMTEMRRTGTVHIVSVSGLHVVICAVSLMFGLSLLPVPRTAQIVILTVILAFYALATGLNPPVIRAIFMSIAGYSAYVFGRESDILSSLAFAAILYLIWQPATVYGIGFQLSFLTVASFALFLKPSRDETDSIPKLLWAKTKEFGVASLVATLFTAPIIGYYFGQISIISVVANVLIAAVMTPLLVISMVAHLVGWMWPVSTIVFGQLGWLEMILDFTSRTPVVNVPEFNAYWLLPIYAALLLTWRPSVRQP